jgi:hypothetical protein
MQPSWMGMKENRSQAFLSQGELEVNANTDKTRQGETGPLVSQAFKKADACHY